MSDEQTRHPLAARMDAADIAHEILVASRAIREGANGLRDLAIEYDRTGRFERARFIATCDRWVAAIVRSWDALRERIEGDPRP